MEFIDTKNSFMSIKAKIVKGATGASFGTPDAAGTISLTAQALFKQVEVTVQGKFVTSATGHYPYKAMIHTLLKYGNVSKISQITSQLFYRDTPGHVGDDDAKTGNNEALKL